jgi:DNA-binding PadR family transcriptional regulator
MALGTLASHGPQHGHQIRRTAEVTNVVEWGGISIGALYRELKLMAGEGLVTEVRTEKVGRRPARTIYAITSEGRLELTMLRERAIKNFHVAPDPLGVALTFSGEGDDPEEFASWLGMRRAILAVALADLARERQRLVGKGYIGPLQSAVMRRGELIAEAELAWHGELEAQLAELRATSAHPEQGRLPGSQPGGPAALPARSDPTDPAGPADPTDPTDPTDR